jgi:hypothetical protein
MTPARIIAIILIVAGIAGLIVPRFTYTKETHSAELGPLSVSVDEKESVGIPAWAAIAAIVVGAGLLFVPGKKS